MEAGELAVFHEGSDIPSDIISADREKKKEFVLFCRVQDAMRHVPNFVETCKSILDAVMDEMDAEKCSVV